MSHEDQAPMRLRWARMRFSIISHLLASPPEPGELAGRIAELAQKPWRHPTKGSVIRLSPKTIERMYYAARGTDDPLGALARKIPKHAGTHPRVTAVVAAAIESQYRDHPRWTWQLHHDNLVALAKTDPALSPVPSYTTVRRFMKARGLYRFSKRRQGRAAEAEIVPRETRSYELTYVNALWHYDFHEGNERSSRPAGSTRRRISLACSTTARGCAATRSGTSIARTPRTSSTASARGSRSGVCRAALTAIGEVP
jgi:hypothetical protein